MRTAVTDHAMRRYIDRVRPWITWLEARTDLWAAMAKMRRAGRTPYGQALWVVDDPPMRLVTKQDGDTLVLVTVLGQGEEPAEEDRLPFPAHSDPAPPAPKVSGPSNLPGARATRKHANLARAAAEQEAARVRKAERATRHAAMLVAHSGLTKAKKRKAKRKAMDLVKMPEPGEGSGGT